MTPVLGIMALLAIAAFIISIMHTMGKAPLWVAVLLLCIFALLQCWPK